MDDEFDDVIAGKSSSDDEDDEPDEAEHNEGGATTKRRKNSLSKRRRKASTAPKGASSVLQLKHDCVIVLCVPDTSVASKHRGQLLGYVTKRIMKRLDRLYNVARGKAIGNLRTTGLSESMNHCMKSQQT